MGFLSKFKNAKAAQKWEEDFRTIKVMMVDRFDPKKSLSKLGLVQEDQFEQNWARDLVQEAQDAFGEAHSNVAISCYLVSEFFALREDAKQAEEYRKQADETVEKIEEKKGIERSEVLSAMGLFDYGRAKYEQAEELFKRAISSFKPVKVDEWGAAPHYYNIAFCQVKLDKIEEAFTSMEQAYDIARKQKGEQDDFVGEIHQKMVEVQQHRKLVREPDDDVTLEEWRDFAKRVCRYLGDSFTGSMTCRPPGMFIRGEKALYFIMPAGVGLRVYSVEGAAPDIYGIHQFTFQETVGKFLREIPNLAYPSMHKSHSIMTGLFV